MKAAEKLRKKEKKLKCNRHQWLESLYAQNYVVNTSPIQVVALRLLNTFLSISYIEM